MTLIEDHIPRPNELFTHPITVNVPSNWANLANFLVFDVVLVTLVFMFTSELAGRLNGWSLSDGRIHPLHIFLPPVVGGGLCSIRRVRGYVLAFVRVFALALVLVSNACIEGSDLFSAVRENRPIRTIGSLKNLTTAEFENTIMLRSGCRKQLEDGRTLYGDLRVLPDDTMECITDERLLTKPLIIGKYVDVPLDTGECTLQREMTYTINAPPRLFNVSFEMKACERATLRCSIPVGIAVIGKVCKGIVKQRGKKGKTYLCDEEQISESNRTVVRTCMEMENVDYRMTEWVDGAQFFTKVTPYIIDEIMATFAARTVTRKVLIEKRTPITYISPMWFMVMAMKVGIVLVLGASIAWLWKNGYNAVAHDEPRLAELIVAGLDESPPPSSNGVGTSDTRSACSSSNEIRITGRKTSGSGLVVSAIGYNELGPSINEEKDRYERQFW